MYTCVCVLQPPMYTSNLPPKTLPFFLLYALLLRLCCSYGLFDFEYMHQCQGTSESSKKQKLFLMSWCPDTAKVSLVLYIQKNPYNNIKN